jgi:tetratricopeptide (TPR) repeat protein
LLFQSYMYRNIINNPVLNKKFLLYPVMLAGMALMLSSCSSLKGTKLYIFYHNTTARFNGYFNAKEKMLDMEDRMFDNHVDNYNKILDVFTGTDESNVKTYTGDNDVIIKKCSNVITKHAVSKWVKNSYFLIGKANFYKRDYYTAIETFEYVNERYSDSRIGQESRVWLIRCYMELNKLNDAQGLIASYEVDKKFPTEIKPYLSLVEADYAIRTNDLKTAITKMEYAIPRVKEKKYRTRYMFILAQLYQANDQAEKSASFYKTVIKRNPPYELSFQSQLKLAEVSSNSEEVKKYLLKLLKDDRNISFNDQIYYTLAKVEQKQGNTDKALEYLRLSTRTSKGNNNQKAMSYIMEADIYFKMPVYPYAKMYYDSASRYMTKDYPNYEAFKARQAVLSDLINDLITVQMQDSLLKISKLDTAAINKLIDEMVEKNKQKSLQQNQNNQNVQQQMPTLNIPGTEGFSTGKESYFYNALALSQGYSEFLTKWGNRPRTDDWRRKNKPVAMENNPDTSGGQKTTGQGDENINPGSDIKKVAASRQKYYQPIPFSSSQKNIANSKIQDALFGMGNIYFNNLHELKKAEETFEELLTRYPNGNYVVQAHYNLYSIYAADSNKEKSDYHKNIILRDFPGTLYAQLIVNPDQLRQKYVKSKKNEDLENFYSTAYNHFLADDCASLENDLTESNSRFTKNYLRPKFEYLLLVCKGKKDSVGRFIESLKGFIQKYPGEDITSDVKKQIDYLQGIQKKTKNEQLSKDSVKIKEQILGKQPEEKVDYQKTENQAHQFVIVFPSKANTGVVKTAITNYNDENYQSQQLQIISNISLDENRQLIIVKNFKDYKQALQYFDELEKMPHFYSDLALEYHQEFVISDTNLGMFIKHKDVVGYTKFFKENYLP